MNRSQMQETLELISYKADGFSFKIGEKDGTLFLQGLYPEEDIVTKKIEIQKTRKWILSEHMTPSELVQTAFKCVMASAEHRVREHFTYRGKRVFGPHFDVEALVQICKDKRFDYRK